VSEPLFPLFLRLHRRPVLVVGAGPVGLRKIVELVSSGAAVTVVAPSVVAEVEALATAGTVTLVRRRFVDADADGAWLIVAATGDATVNAEVAAAGEARRIFVNAVDDPPNASAWFGAILRRAPFLIAISSSGELPALSRLYREILESALPLDRHIAAARELRRRWRADGTPMAARFGELLQRFVAGLPNEDLPGGSKNRP